MFHHVSINKIYFIVENNFCVNNSYVVEHIEQTHTLCGGGLLTFNDITNN